MFHVNVLLLLVTLFYVKEPVVFSVTPKSNDKIVGGKNTTIKEHPHQVSLQLTERHICGGSIVAPNIVVSAAHCVEGMKGYLKWLKIRAGSTVTYTGGQVVSIKRFYIHPKYKRENSYDYDCSILVLKNALTFNTEVQAIGIQNVDNEVATGTLATVTGWGTLSFNGPFPTNLQVVLVPKMDVKQCQRNYEYESISDRMHCFGYVGGRKDSCSGDSGGPLVVDKKLTGIVSWGYGCGHRNRPGVYAKVSDREINTHITDMIAKHGKH